MKSDIFAAVIILSAGRGLRAGGNVPKQYALLGGAPLIRRTVEAFLDFRAAQQAGEAAASGPQIGRIIMAVNPADADLCRRALGSLSGRIELVDGGATRQDSTYNALLRLAQLPQPPAYVHIHDGARPFIRPPLLAALGCALSPHNGVVPALPVAETLKRANAQGFVSETVPRANLYAAQTPQSFPFAAILRAHEAARASGRSDFTDDSALAEAAGLPVKLIEGDSRNVKITWERDLAMADKFLQNQQMNAADTGEAGGNRPRDAVPCPDIRTGNGYDVHRLIPGDHVVLCGVKIPAAQALQGHSDADVALHALTDALLATCGAADIGAHFPPSDPRWKGADSSIFLRHAAQLIKQKGGQIINADITLIAEAPKIGPHRAAMVARLAELLELAEERISVKATTNERLGFIGREEGIAAIATANVFYRS